MLLRKQVNMPVKILRSEPSADIDKVFKKKLNKSIHNTCNQNARDFIKSVNFAIVYILDVTLATRTQESL